MMEWVEVIAYFLTNEIRILLGVLFTAVMAGQASGRHTAQDPNPGLVRKLAGMALAGGLIVTVPVIRGLPPAAGSGAEILWICVIIRSLKTASGPIAGLRMSLFFAFFYELGTALWDFLISAWLGVLFASERFLRPDCMEYHAALILVRLAMTALAMAFRHMLRNSRDEAGDRAAGENGFMRLAAMITALGLFGLVSLSEQTVIRFSDDELTTWIFLDLILMFAVMMAHMERQRAMEEEIVRLRSEQAELLERDYRALSETYSANAKLYHDLHNHIEALYQSLKHGDVEGALEYCEDLRAPVKNIAENVWTGEKAVDYLVNSKLASAGEKGIRMEIDVEYPRNTGIRSADLAAVLGNLLDNALESVEKMGAGDGNTEKCGKEKPESQGFITLKIRQANEMLVIRLENSCGASPVLENGEIRSSKADKNMHGWGLKSIRGVAQRYDGAVSTEYESGGDSADGKGVFRTVVTLSCRRS